MPKKILLCSASALMLCVSGDALAERPALPVTHAHGEVHRIIVAAPGSVTLYDQNNDDAGVGVVSTHFTDDFVSYSSYGADDFTVPAGHKWSVREVEVTGAYKTANGPAASENIAFYKEKRGLPGKLVVECDNLSGIDNRGSFAIKLPKSCKVSLAGNHRYWVSVSANLDFACCGEWVWETRNSQNGNPAAWENPDGGFGICPTWEIMTSCASGEGEGSDFMLTLKGKDIVQ